MSRLRHLDILVELIELCHERMNEVRQELVYYRASVYKNETSSAIHEKIERLQILADLFGDFMIQEAFSDYESMGSDRVMNLPPGECFFSSRVTTLLQSLDHHLVRLGHELLARNFEPSQEEALTTAVKAKRKELLALCRQGTRQWTFFESI